MIVLVVHFMTDPRQSDGYDFGRLFVRDEARIYGYIRSLVVHRADAEDLLQETASVLWQKFHEFQPGSNFLAWAMSIARFQVRHFRRKEAQRPPVQRGVSRSLGRRYRGRVGAVGRIAAIARLVHAKAAGERSRFICAPLCLGGYDQALPNSSDGPRRPFTMLFVVFAGHWPTV